MLFEKLRRRHEHAIGIVAGVADQQGAYLGAGLARKEGLRGDEDLLDVIWVLKKVGDAVGRGDGAHVIELESLLQIREPSGPRSDCNRVAFEIGERVYRRIRVDHN